MKSERDDEFKVPEITPTMKEKEIWELMLSAASRGTPYHPFFRSKKRGHAHTPKGADPRTREHSAGRKF